MLSAIMFEGSLLLIQSPSWNMVWADPAFLKGFDHWGLPSCFLESLPSSATQMFTNQNPCQFLQSDRLIFSSGCQLALERVSYGASWWRFLFVVGLSNGRKHEGRFTFGTIELNESTLLLPITDNDNTCIHVRRCYPLCLRLYIRNLPTSLQCCRCVAYGSQATHDT